jgi:hypothetical protein
MCYQERKLSNHVAWRNYQEGVVVSYYGRKECVAGVITILAIKAKGYKEPVLDVGFLEDKLEQLRTNDYLPAEKYPYLLLRFYDTYIYT